MHVQKLVNRCVAGLNSMYFGGGSRVLPTPVSSLTELEMASQREALAHIIQRVHSAGKPPHGFGYSGALQALRVTSSPYGDSMTGVGEVVSMCLDALSVPDMNVKGVPITELLDGAAGKFIKDPENYMLQDSSNWGAVCDDVAKIRIYDDPKLRNRMFYLRYLKKLHKAGILSWSCSPKGRVGSFVVKKKPKDVNGKLVNRQRLILDCRQVNLLFRAPPATELGSLPALGDIYIPDKYDLHIAGADIRDCFYACSLPSTLRDYFCFTGDITLEEAHSIFGSDCFDSMGLDTGVIISPCLDVLPMGYSWSFYLVQALHVQACLESSGEDCRSVVLDARPPPSLVENGSLFMPYCDNTHVLSLDSHVASQDHSKLQSTLESWGFAMHEELGPTTIYPTLGGVIDGHAGLVKPNRDRFWNLVKAFTYVCYHPVSSEMIMRLLGHAMVVLVLNRSGMSVFRNLYDFSSRGYRRKMLWESAIRECRTFVGILPLLISDMRRPWSNTVFCSDASPEGYGITERNLDVSTIDQIGLWQERWRYKRTPPDQWRPRERALQLDPFSDINTAKVSDILFEEGDCYTRNEEFEEIPHSILNPQDWRVAKFGKWQHTQEHITLKEARALTILVRRITRAAKFRGRRILVLVDNLALALCLGKGRSPNHAMLRVSQKIGALCLACNLALRVRWIPSELNNSDGPSRGSHAPGVFNKDGTFMQTFPSSSSFAEDNGLRGSQPSHSKGGLAGCEEADGDCEEKSVLEGEKQDCNFEALCGGHFTHAPDQPQEDSWFQSKDREYVCLRDTKHQQRATEPVWLLPGEVQKLVQGERHQVSGGGSDGCDPRRLLRRPVLGRKRLPRGRENIGGSRVPISQTAGQIDQISEGASWVEEVGSTEEQAPLATDCGIWDSDEIVPPTTMGHGSHGPFEFRCLPTSRGSCGSLGEKSHQTSVVCRSPIQELHDHCERRGRGEARQNRDLQQFNRPGQPIDSCLAGASLVETEVEAWKRSSTLSSEDGKIPCRISEGRRMAGLAKAAHLPAETWRRVRGLSKSGPRVQHGERPWEMADRHIGEEVCQDWQTTEPDCSDAGMGRAVLQEGNIADASGCGRSCCPMQPLGPPSADSGCGRSCCPKQPVYPVWQDWRQWHDPCVLEIFAGSGRLTLACRKLGIVAFAIDSCLSNTDDLLDPAVESQLISMILSGCVRLVWLGMPCTTFSIARKDDGVGPGPLRSDQYPMGLPDLCPRDQKKVSNGNALLFVTVRLVMICIYTRTAFVVENPHSSRCWLTFLMQQLQSLSMCKFLHLDFCGFGEAWKKPTGLLHAFLDLSSLAITCKGSSRICGFTGKRHLPLKGYASNGQFMTLVAQPYPFKLVNAVSALVLQQLW